MRPYRVEVQRSAERELSRLSAELFARVTTKISALAEDPRPPGAQKLMGLDGYRIRVGDYRILYELDDTTRVVFVTRVRHRRDVYRRLR